MENLYTQDFNNQSPDSIHWGHFGIIILSIVLLAGVTWFQKPEMFSLKKNQNIFSGVEVPKYYAYVPSEEDMTPLVAGATTDQGPSLINEDGSISQVDIGEVLGASTENVVLNLDDIKLKTIPSSIEAVNAYLQEIKNVMNGPIDNTEFQTALSSGNQALINIQAKKFESIKNNLLQIPVPEDLVKLAKLTVVQYTSAVGLLTNFTRADQNPELVGQYLQEFLKSQQDLDNENNLVAEKYKLNQNLILKSDLENHEPNQNLENLTNLNGQ